jgi:hypothetical protein
LGQNWSKIQSSTAKRAPETLTIHPFARLNETSSARLREYFTWPMKKGLALEDVKVVDRFL